MSSNAFANILLFLVAAGYYFGHGAAQNQTCDPNLVGVQPITDLNIDRLLHKEWYVHEIYTRLPEDAVEPSFNCYMHYIRPYLGDSSILLVEQYTDIENGIADHNGSWVFGQGFGENAAVWSVTSNWAWEQYTTIFTHTDYVNYGVMHWCPVPAHAVHNYERVMVFSGSGTRNESLLAELRGMVASLGFPTDNVVGVHHHADCDYEYVYTDDGDESNNVADQDFES